MARRFRQLVSQLRKRELGVRRRRPDAAAHRQHQRPADQGWRAQISLAPRSPSRRSPIAQRARPLGAKLETTRARRAPPTPCSLPLVTMLVVIADRARVHTFVDRYLSVAASLVNVVLTIGGGNTVR